ncbi:arginyl-tRNA--protein transferase 1 isoform X1 [Aplysia californica]|uniref:Arginyl-tRNA--protein transferase 1 n=1 Tax=Aplysia californica TaxID=6500 RepID=A0ABM0JMV6_APLCA|nr:arginyl-tRNA--protein transferase 1 isoform X1 [Aplysia californica]
MDEDPTIVEYFREHERYRCGYCGSKDTNYSHGMWAHQMTVQDYQDLIDRGWRRSGKYCYKPTMKLTCCPQYTIRCDTSGFKLNKSHKKVIKKVNRFLITGVKSSAEEDAKDNDGQEKECGDVAVGGSKAAENALADRARPSDIEMPRDIKKKKADNPETSTEIKGEEPVSMVTGNEAKQPSAPLKATTTPSNSEKSIPRQGSGADPNKPACRKAKEIRAERRQMKQAKAGDSGVQQKKQKQSNEKSLEDFLSEPDKAENPAHKLETRLYRSAPESIPFRVSFLESHSVYQKYQMTVHNDGPADCDKMGFKNFLVDSPLEEKHIEGGIPDGYGSFHQHYLLDGKIIAVGVIDILPACVSSVYFYYDPEYSFLGLGVYSALREIAFVRQLQRLAPELKYYYMGFYIHSCPKMRYKGQYTGSFISCPETYSWVPIEKCRPKLDASNYARLEEEGVEDKDKDVDLNQVLCLHQGTMLPYAFYKMMKKSKTPDEDEVREYAGFVGKTCAERMLLVRK